VSHTGIVLIHFVSLSQDEGGLKELQDIFKRMDDKDESTEVCLLFLFLMELQGVRLYAQPLTLILSVWYRTIINQYEEEHRSLALSKSTKAPTIKSTKAPTIKSTKAPTIKSTKAPTIKSTKAPAVSSKSRRRNLSVADSMEDELADKLEEE
jgi:hypothetical protein